MFSFLNGKSPFDEAEEKLEAGETINGKPKLPTAPIMGWQDGVFLLVLIALIFGGYQYYSHSKKTSAEMFLRCDTQFVQAQSDVTLLPLVEACYDSTWDLGFVSDSMEILRQNRLGYISDKRTFMKDLLDDAKDALFNGDTSLALEILSKNKEYILLRKDEQEEWKKIIELKR